MVTRMSVGARVIVLVMVLMAVEAAAFDPTRYRTRDEEREEWAGTSGDPRLVRGGLFVLLPSDPLRQRG